MSVSTVSVPVAVSSLPRVEDHEAKRLRAMFDVNPADVPDIFAGRAESHRASVVGHTASLVLSPRFSPSDVFGPDGFVARLRLELRTQDRLEARSAFVAELAAGGDPPASMLAPPVLDATAEAERIVRAMLAHEPGVSFRGLVRTVDVRIAMIRAELAKVQTMEPELSADMLDWLHPVPGEGNHGVTHRHKATISAVEDSSATLAAKRASEPELTAALDRLGAWRDRLTAAFKRRAAEVVAANGGAAAMAESLREATRLGDAAVAKQMAILLDGNRKRLAENDAALELLGIDPASPPKTVGLAAKQLLEDRRLMVMSAKAAQKSALERESASAAEQMATACGGCPATWWQIGDYARMSPTAFAPGFVEAWDEIAPASVLEAGAVELVESFEAA